jgi:hypothetical protein
MIALDAFEIGLAAGLKKEPRWNQACYRPAGGL